MNLSSSPCRHFIVGRAVMSTAPKNGARRHGAVEAHRPRNPASRCSKSFSWASGFSPKNHFPCRGEMAISRPLAGQGVGISQTRRGRGSRHTPEQKRTGDRETPIKRPRSRSPALKMSSGIEKTYLDGALAWPPGDRAHKGRSGKKAGSRIFDGTAHGEPSARWCGEISRSSV